MSARILSSGQLMNRIIRSLNRKSPLSVISIGSTESFVMAQYHILSEEEFMNHREAKRTNRSGRRGFKFPNATLRDQMIRAAKQADIVGYNIAHRVENAGLMTERVFKKYHIRPKVTYDSLIRRVIMFSQKKKFKEMLRNRRIVLIGNIATETKRSLNRRWKEKLNFKIVKSINMKSFDEMDKVKKMLDEVGDYDLALIAAGVNAVILAPYIARKHGKVAFDLGQGMGSLTSEQVRVTGFVRSVGLKNLMRM